MKTRLKLTDEEINEYYKNNYPKIFNSIKYKNYRLKNNNKVYNKNFLNNQNYIVNNKVFIDRINELDELGDKKMINIYIILLVIISISIINPIIWLFWMIFGIPIFYIVTKIKKYFFFGRKYFNYRVIINNPVTNNYFFKKKIK